jgi:hypothetical protein
MTMPWNWSNLNTLNHSMTLTNPCWIFYIIITTENFRIKKPSTEVKISNLNIYPIVCCQNHKGTMVYDQLH